MTDFPPWSIEKNGNSSEYKLSAEWDRRKTKKADGEKPDSKICTYFNQTLEINLTRYDKITETLLNPLNIDGMKCSILIHEIWTTPHCTYRFLKWKHSKNRATTSLLWRKPCWFSVHMIYWKKLKLKVMNEIS